MRRSVTAVICTVIASLFFTQYPVHAKVYYQGNPTIYVRPDPSYQAGQALGNLLGMLVQASNQKAAQEK
jgi:hypothetical protein